MTARFSRPLLAGGGAVAGGLLLAFLRRRQAGAVRVHAEPRPRSSALPAPDVLARSGTSGIGPLSSWPSRVLPNEDNLRAFVLTVITNIRTPVAIRNSCHHLMVAIEQNNQTLIEEILVDLAHVADRTDFLLPPLSAPAPLG